MNRLISFFAKQGIFADLLTVAVLITGLAAFISIRKEVFPNVKFDIITIATTFPGSSPDEVERLITNTIEQDLKEVDGIKKLTSTSIEGRSVIVAQLDPDVTTEEKGKSDIKDVIDRAKVDLPEAADEPVVTSVETKLNPVIELAVAGDMPEMELRNLAKSLKEEFEEIPGVGRIVANGLQDIEILVEADQQKLSRYRVSLDDLINALRGRNLSIPGGDILVSEDNRSKEKIVRTVGEFQDFKDVQDTVVRANDLGQSIRVKDVAKVSIGLEKVAIKVHAGGKRAVNLTILKKAQADVIDVVDRLRVEVAKKQKSLEGSATLTLMNDWSKWVRRRLGILSNNLGVGLILILVVLSLILPFRVALVVSVGIPFSFLGTMIWFHLNNNGLNMISLMGMIIVTGMLVDDAIVVTDNAVRLMEEGKDPETAAVEGTQQIWAPVTTSVLTTVFAFMPLMLMSGIMGKFIVQIPIAVIVALAVSLLEVFFIMPHHIAKWIVIKKRHGQESTGRLDRILAKTEYLWDHKVTPTYIRMLDFFMRNRKSTMAGTLVLFIISLGIAAGPMKKVLFPPEGIEIFMIKADAPIGTSLEQTTKLTEQLERIVDSLPKNELANYLTTLGIQQQDVNDPFTRRGKNYSMIKVFLTPEKERDRKAKDIIASLREKSDSTVKGFDRVLFQRINPGPPVGKPISLGVRGKEYEIIMPAVQRLKEELRKMEGVTDISDNYSEGTEEILVIVSHAEAAAANLSVGKIGNTVRAAYEGIVATTIKKLDEDYEIRVTLSDSSKNRRASLDDILIPNAFGNLVPLSRVAKFEDARGIGVYQHEANKRQVQVTAEIDINKTSSNQANDAILKILPDLNKAFPGVTIAFGGEAEDTQESMASLGKAFLLSAMLIFLILVLMFQNLLQPLLIIFGTIPLGIISVIWTFLLQGMPLSFMAMMGVVALSGVIVNNAIVLVDFINKNRLKGMGARDSIFDAARKRIRPIFLTTITTVFGLLPTAYGIGGKDMFVVPIAMSLGWGMLLGSVLVSFVFPCAIAVLDDMTSRRHS